MIKINYLYKKLHIKLNTQLVIVIILIFIWLFLSLKTDGFFTVSNMQNLMLQVSITGIAAIGMCLIIITAGIDLSVGSVMALVNIILAKLLVNGLPVFPSILIVLLLSSLIGFIQGYFIYYFSVPPFIATLAMMSIARGSALLVTGGRNITGLPREIAEFSSNTFLGIPLLFWLLILVIILMEILLRRTTFGRYVYALGSNPEATRLSGINIGVVLIGVYIIGGFFWGLAGILETTRVWMGVPSIGLGYELDVIAAAVLGGASLMGAVGSVSGAFLGALVMATIYNGAVLLNINPFWQRVIIGIILLIMVSIDQFRMKKK